MGKLHPTNIQWCTHTVNPIVAVDRATGKQGWACTKVATGCMHCYAEALNVGRFGTGHPFDVASESLVEWQLDEAALQSVLRRQKSATIFWCDMTDLFHERVPDKWVDQCFAVMALTPHLRHLVLTKRPARMREYLNGDDWGYDSPYTRVDEAASEISGESGVGVITRWPLPNVALGTSVSNQDDADRNIPHLLDTPAALRFVSYEPAIAEVDFRGEWQPEGIFIDWLRGTDGTDPRIPGIDLIIIGGESGPKARPFDLAWARSTIAQCEAAGVVAMVKQLGRQPREHYLDASRDWPVDQDWVGNEPNPPSGDREDDWWRPCLRDSHGGDPAEWPEDLRLYAASPERWPWATGGKA